MSGKTLDKDRKSSLASVLMGGGGLKWSTSCKKTHPTQRAHRVLHFRFPPHLHIGFRERNPHFLPFFPVFVPEIRYCHRLLYAQGPRGD